ncbi:hypothetical protein [Caloramator sp. Dgby_cultured_2]|uniref:hypothetical protein n=1 Tax=Caloramator sp. Dgby_cultured_2 TaxID=3029174 RepID=UPI00237D713C|nr:hypothetical protein [Caloramator sp. Dgby_cultured_2]WDU84201.1 hypothetical protein PWK10_07740 [Caloramator sp. Dgby_cultured_2]
MNNLKIALADIGNTIMEVAAPAVQLISEKAKQLSEWFQGVDDNTKKVIVIIGGIAAAIGPLLVVVGTLAGSIGNIIGLFGTFAGSAAAATTATAVAGTAATATGGALAGLVAPIGIAIAAITGLIAIFVALYKNNEDFRNSCNQTWNNVKQLISSITGQIKSIIQNFTQLVSALWNKWGDEIMIVVNTAFKNISTIISTILNVIAGIIKTVTSLIKGDWQGAWGGIKQIVTSVWNGIKNVISNTLGGLKNLIGSVLGEIKNTFSNIWNSIWDMTASIFNRIKNFIVDIFSNIHIPLPHLSVGIDYKEIAGAKIPIPSFDVNWYDTGGIFTRPAIIGVAERRPEFVGALDDLRFIVRDELNKTGGNSKTPINVYVYDNVFKDGREAGDKISEAIRRLGL